MDQTARVRKFLLGKTFRQRSSTSAATHNLMNSVPGFGGAQFEAKLNGKPEVVHYFCSKTTNEFFDLWLNLELLPLLVVDCWADNMRLVYNSTTTETSDMPGVEIRIPGFGTTDNVEWLDKSKTSPSRYFTDIVDKLINQGYKRGKDLRGAPFDWRRAPNEMTDFFANLKDLIEETYKYNGNKKIVIITHSMGSPLMLYFYNKLVNNSWKSKFIKSHVSLGGAWGGAVQVVKMLASGYNMDHFRIVLPPSRLRGMQRSFMSSFFLFPNEHFWSKEDTFATANGKNYSIANIKEFFTDINYENGWSQYQVAGRLLEDFSSPNIEMHCAYGIGVGTPEFLQWPKKYFPDYQPTITYGDGDGTVNRRSLEACQKWIANNGGKKVVLYPINATDHIGILQHDAVLQLISQIVNEEQIFKE